MNSGLDPNRVDKVLRQLRPNALDYLRVFYSAGEGAQYQRCADDIGVGEATFAKGMKDLDIRINALTGAAILRRTPTGWALTTVGVELGERLTESRIQLYEALDDARDALTVRIRLASDCWREYGELLAAVRGADLSILPNGVRSTELKLHEPGSPPPQTLARSHGMYTTCQDTDRLTRDDKGRVTLAHMPETEVIISRTAPFQVLMPKGIFAATTETISHADLVDSGISLLLPEEGAVIDYLNLLEPPYSPSRVRRHGGGTDFDHCMGALRSGSYPRSAMIVHGLVSAQIPKGFMAISLSDRPTVRAVTGLYRRHIPSGGDHKAKPWPNETEEAWLTVWRRALTRWGATEFLT